MVNKGTKRRWIAVLTIMAILAMMLKFVMPSVVHAYAEETNVTVGDADSDGKITIVDAYYILLADSKRSVGMQVDVDLSIYDVDFNGRLDIMDAYLTLLYNSYVSVGRKDVIWPPVNGSIMTTTQTTNTTEPITTNQTTTTSANTNNVTHYESGDVLQFSGISWNVRSGVGGYVIGTIETGEKFQIVSWIQGEWYLIRFGEENGYIKLESPWLFKKVNNNQSTIMTTTTTAQMTTTNHETTTTITTSQTTTTSANTNNVAQYESGDVLQFSGISWNVRSGVGGYVIGTIETGEKFQIVSWIQGEWYLIRFGEENGYIKLESPWLFKKVNNNQSTIMTTTTTAQMTTTNHETTTTITTSQTTTTSANINNAPQYENGDLVQFSGVSWNIRSGVDGYVIGTIETGEKVRIVSRAENQWYIIQIDNGIGYINIESPWLFKEVGYVQPELKKVVSFDLVEFGDILVFYDQIVEVKTSNGIRYLQYGDKVIVTGKETNESISVAIVDSTDEGTIDYNNNSGFFKTYK